MPDYSLLITKEFYNRKKKQKEYTYFFGFCDKRKKQKGVIKNGK